MPEAPPVAPEASQVDEFRGKLRNGLTFTRRVAVEKLGGSLEIVERKNQSEQGVKPAAGCAVA